MIYSYLFEAKSIQSYLFRSGKLKDVIAASERLDKLIDSTKTSTLFQVLVNAGITSDLLDANSENKPEQVRFLRCKGGAFYAYCEQQTPLLALRSLWTLTVQQLFPSMEFADALTQASSLQEAINKGHEELAADRHSPSIKLPIATAITKRYDRTGAVSVPVSALARRAVMKDKPDDTKQAPSDNALDCDTELHRQAYQALGMRDRAALQDRFTPDKLKGELYYPINLDKEFEFSAPDARGANKEAIKDIALIHIDGNGLGILLMGLRDALKNETDDVYRKGFRDFSNALSKATETAAQVATAWLHQVSAYQHKSHKDKISLPMRPLVLGGDDITLLCRADLALEFSKRFCLAFKDASTDTLKALYQAHLKQAGIKPFLTASGGILYHKAGHPFTQSHHLVEHLCSAAKKLTKSVNTTDKEVGPAALAFYRLSNSVADSFDDIKSQSQQFNVRDNQDAFTLDLGLNAFFVEAENNAHADLSTLGQMVALCQNKTAPVSIAKWRQMATHLALGNKTEADRIYHRAISLSQNQDLVKTLKDNFQQFAGQNDAFHDWYWQTSEGHCQTIINDLLIADHFSPVISKTKASTTEPAQ